MAEIKTLALPVPNQDYDAVDQANTRRILEQAIEDINVKISRVQALQDTLASKSSKRSQFLLMGVKHG
jgi:hypothetical protein|tara:strand:- start:519 stop:722 length:204 start_codon:yes stop_codon:yes gene_type:complete